MPQEVPKAPLKGPQDASKPKENGGRMATSEEAHSLQGYIATRMGGPIEWGVIREKEISGSSCIAEIKAMGGGAKATQLIRHLLQELGLERGMRKRHC